MKAYTVDNELLNAKIAALESKRPLARAMKNKQGLYCSTVLRHPAGLIQAAGATIYAA
jgi:hypothetical protein